VKRTAYVWAALGALALLGATLWRHGRTRGIGIDRPKGVPVSETALWVSGDKPATIFVRVLVPSVGEVQTLPALIHRSQSRLDQMKQSVLAYLNAAGNPKARSLAPKGSVLNEMYLTDAGTAAVDLSVPLDPEFGFTEEARFVEGLNHALLQNFQEIKRVRILNDGRESGTLTGHYALGTYENLTNTSPGKKPDE